MQKYICDRYFNENRSTISFFQRYKPNCGKSVEKAFKKFVDPVPETDNFQNLINSSLSADLG